MRKFICILLAACLCSAVWAQKADLRRGNRQFAKGEFAQADISYRKGLMQDTSSVAAHYNLGNNLYRQRNFDEAAAQLDASQLTAGDTDFAADYYFNRGDVAIAQEDWQTAVNMFKESLRRNPGDLEAKENYIYARNKLMEQQQNQDQDDQNQPQDNNQNQQDQDDQDQEQQNQPPKEKEQKQQEQPELNPQQAQQLLQAIQEKEKQTQEKVDEKKAQAQKSRQKEKNW